MVVSPICDTGWWLQPLCKIEANGYHELKYLNTIEKKLGCSHILGQGWAGVQVFKGHIPSSLLQSSRRDTRKPQPQPGSPHLGTRESQHQGSHVETPACSLTTPMFANWYFPCIEDFRRKFSKHNLRDPMGFQPHLPRKTYFGRLVYTASASELHASKSFSDVCNFSCGVQEQGMLKVKHALAFRVERLERNKRHCNNYILTSSTTQGDEGSSKNRKPIGEVGCCKSRKAEQIHRWNKRWLDPQAIYLSVCLSMNLSSYLASKLASYLSIYLSFQLSGYPSIYLAI